MIQAQFERDSDGIIHYFQLTGHADSGPYGSDIVCAAVSAVAIGAVNGIQQLAAITPKVKADSDNGGHLECRLPQNLNADQANTAQIILANFLLSLESIAENYSDYVTIKK
ncbi:ribosomal-processing cysteine protease Prp [Loigolactobacillus jiayinensis]|mgnify:CR=1 FL=1|uniref:Ribosomal processing cysteine protease Prp n=1 Tax=Loigolactobacillus jiayinensis TaxID=2486016 RepID=A0ABW1RDP9_9LACO|nr:ribosomal-processing cysteine protease Prp [Loigolactobacillus jiayinensis]